MSNGNERCKNPFDQPKTCVSSFLCFNHNNWVSHSNMRFNHREQIGSNPMQKTHIGVFSTFKHQKNGIADCPIWLNHLFLGSSRMGRYLGELASGNPVPNGTSI